MAHLHNTARFTAGLFSLPQCTAPLANRLCYFVSQSHQPFVIKAQVEMRGLEPLASAVQRRRSPKLSYIPIKRTG